MGKYNHRILNIKNVFLPLVFRKVMQKFRRAKKQNFKKIWIFLGFLILCLLAFSNIERWLDLLFKDR